MDQQILLDLRDLVHKTPISQHYLLLQLLRTCFAHNSLTEGSHVSGLMGTVCRYMHMCTNLTAHMHLREPEAHVRCFPLSLFTLIFEADRSPNLELAIWIRLASLRAPGSHMCASTVLWSRMRPHTCLLHRSSSGAACTHSLSSLPRPSPARTASLLL